MLERCVVRISDFLSTPGGFVATLLTALSGLPIMWAFDFSEFVVLAVNLYLSVAAIVIGGAVLVQNDRDTTALHAKLDDLILKTDGPNDLVGIEHEQAARVREARAEVERQA